MSALFVTTLFYFCLFFNAITRCRSDPLSYFASTNIFLIFRGGETKPVFLSHPLVQSHHHLPVTHPLVTVALLSSFSHKQHQRRFHFIFIPGFCCIPRFGYRFSRVILTESKEKGRERWIETLDSLFLISRFHFTVFELRVFSSDSLAFRQGYYRRGGYAIDFALIRIESDFIAIMTQVPFLFFFSRLIVFVSESGHVVLWFLIF